MKENSIYDLMTKEEQEEEFRLLIGMNHDHATIEDRKRYNYYMQSMRLKYGKDKQ